MKNSRVVLASVFVAMLVLSQMTAFAQGRGMRSPEERAKQLQEQIALTDSQTVKITKIYQDGQKKMTDMMGSGDRDGMRAAMMKMTAQQDSVIEKMLTKEQLAKYEKVKKERQERMRQFQRGQ